MPEEQDDYLEDNPTALGISWVKIGLAIWVTGIIVAGCVAGGIGIYYVLFLILGAVCLIICPCLGAPILAGTVGLWAICIAIAGGILIYTSAIASIFGILIPITLLHSNSRNKKTIIIVSIYFMVNLFVGYYIHEIGIYELVFDAKLPTSEEIQNIFNIHP